MSSVLPVGYTWPHCVELYPGKQRSSYVWQTLGLRVWLCGLVVYSGSIHAANYSGSNITVSPGQSYRDPGQSSCQHEGTSSSEVYLSPCPHQSGGGKHLHLSPRTLTLLVPVFRHKTTPIVGSPFSSPGGPMALGANGPPCGRFMRVCTHIYLCILTLSHKLEESRIFALSLRNSRCLGQKLAHRRCSITNG